MTDATHSIALRPRLVVAGAAAAIDFYRSALGAQERARYLGPDGRIVHAELVIGDHVIVIKDEGDGDLAPTSMGGSPVIISLRVTDAEAVASAMAQAGATTIFPVAARPYGERDGRLRDPFGHVWMVSQLLESLAPAEIQRRLDNWLG